MARGLSIKDRFTRPRDYPSEVTGPSGNVNPLLWTAGNSVLDKRQFKNVGGDESDRPRRMQTSVCVWGEVEGGGGGGGW